MLKKSVVTMLILIVLASLLAGCGPANPAVEEGETALTITGATTPEWSLAALRGLETIEVDYTNRDGETTTYTGVPIKRLFEAAGVSATSGTLVLVAADGYSADIPLEEVLACDDCVVAFDGEGLRSVLPEQSGKVQVRELVELKVE